MSDIYIVNSLILVAQMQVTGSCPDTNCLDTEEEKVCLIGEKNLFFALHIYAFLNNQLVQWPLV